MFSRRCFPCSFLTTALVTRIYMWRVNTVTPYPCYLYIQRGTSWERLNVLNTHRMFCIKYFILELLNKKDLFWMHAYILRLFSFIHRVGRQMVVRKLECAERQLTVTHLCATGSSRGRHICTKTSFSLLIP